MQDLSPNYLELRQVALSEGKQSLEEKKDKTCTLVVDIPVRRGFPMTMALRRNGECSIYLCNGGGFIGCHGYPKVEKATKLAFSILDRVDLSSFVSKSSPADCKIPSDAVNVDFYLVSATNVLHKI